MANINDLLKQFQLEFENAKRKKGLDEAHDTKRLGSFILMDIFVNQCLEGICPTIPSGVGYFLVDISVDEYIDVKKYFYGLEGKGMSDQQRYKICKKLIKKILTCKKLPELDTEIFDSDINSIKENPEILDAARHRKAFWTFSKYTPINNPVTDFAGACGLIERIDQFYTTDSEKPRIDSLKNYYKNNFHIVNGLDLFKVCAIRKKRCATSFNQ